jgi:hypothetical protein
LPPVYVLLKGLVTVTVYDDILHAIVDESNVVLFDNIEQIVLNVILVGKIITI